MIIGLIVLVVLGGGVYYFTMSPTEDSMMEKEKMEKTAMMEKEAMEKETMMKADEAKKGDESMMKMEDGTMMKKDAMEKDTVMQKDAMMTKYVGTSLAGESAPLLDYIKADYDAAIASDKLVVLYFYANWCPICKAELANATYPAFNELTTDQVVGIRINYNDNDTTKDEEDLARKYGVAYQHTKVFVRRGQQLLKAPDGWDKARYFTEINKVLAQ